jgi:carbonic anhydrase
MDPKAQHKRTISRYLQQSHERIFENNRKWVAEKKAEDPEFFNKLAAGQQPEFL